VRAMTICAGGSLLVFPEDADGRILPKAGSAQADNPSGRVPTDEPDSSAEQPADEHLVPWLQPAALDAELDPMLPNPPAAVGPQQYVHGCLPCADSAHDFAMAERKVRFAGSSGVLCLSKWFKFLGWSPHQHAACIGDGEVETRIACWHAACLLYPRQI